MSQTTNEPGFDTGTPTTPPRKAWHARTWVRVTGAIAALILAASFGAAAASGTAHPAAKPAAPPATSAPAAPASPKWQSQGAACTPDGATGKDYAGSTLTCQNGAWTYYPETSDPAPSDPATEVPSDPATEAPAEPVGTVSQQQALTSAQGYLDDGQGFSRAGLIDQLEYEKFSHADAAWAADHAGANWDAQAVISAKGYMSDGQGFSRGSLIEQLQYEKFTLAQATYAANKVGL
jgi:hypothetical protein